MSVDWRALFHTVQLRLSGAERPTLPPQQTLWGWTRAALAFQHAHHPEPRAEFAPGNDNLSILGQVHARIAAQSATVGRQDAAGAGAPAEEHSGTGEQMFRRGSVLLATGRYQDAITVLSSVVEAEPEHALALASRAAAHRMLQEHDLAVLDASRAIDLQPDLAWAYATRGAIHRLQKNYEAALEDLDRAIALQPDYEWCIAGRGETYRLQGRAEEALTDLNRALELNPRNDWALMCRGAVYLDTQEEQTALRFFREAVSVNPDGDWALGLAALTYRLMGKDLTRYADDPEATAPPLPTHMRRRRRRRILRRRAVLGFPGIPVVYISAVAGRLYRVEDAASSRAEVVASPEEALAATAAFLDAAEAAHSSRQPASRP
ncbi:tetratricopeptide repeat protein [Streptomyces sp. NPDC007074]|uniref:tetratricopeptide repeat protein n=1 Tax=unclassified Streptomyces TaxID=2593676 RepID=UPI0033D2500A